jgi:hypothetical protein
MKVRELFETQVPIYNGNIKIPEDWKDLSGLPELFPGYTAGCKVTGDFVIRSCDALTTLKGGPLQIDGNFLASFCSSLTSLEGAPIQVGGYFSCRQCSSLTSLKGGPLQINGDFTSYNCISLTSLKGIGKQYLKKCGELLNLDNCSNLKSHMLGILLIKDLKIIHFKNIANEDAGVIIQSHLDSDRDILECQEELITNGLKEYAKL